LTVSRKNAIKGHGFRCCWRLQDSHVRGQVAGFTADGDVIALANPVRHGFGDGHTPDQVSVGSKTLFPLDRVLVLRDD
jgi:hypothetical protein